MNNRLFFSHIRKNPSTVYFDEQPLDFSALAWVIMDDPLWINPMNQRILSCNWKVQNFEPEGWRSVTMHQSCFHSFIPHPSRDLANEFRKPFFACSKEKSFTCETSINFMELQHHKPKSFLLISWKISFPSYDLGWRWNDSSPET